MNKIKILFIIVLFSCVFTATYCAFSVTLEKSGRLLSGQTLEALIATVSPFNIISLGLNCSFGAKDMTPYLNILAEKSPVYLSAYPNAGLPNALG